MREFLHLLSFLGTCSFATSQPITEIDCSPNSPTGIKPECWEALQMGQYIDDWMRTNACSANCQSIGFAQCFLQWHGYTGLTCDLITEDTCPPFSTNATYSSYQEFYALWNIYAVSQFFNQYSTALSNAVSLAGQTIEDIVSTVAPPVSAGVQSSSILDIMAGTLVFMGHTIGLPMAGMIGRIPNIIASGIALGFDLFSELSNTLLSPPSQMADQRFVQLGQIGSSLSQFVIGYQNNVVKMVQMIQGNSTIFSTVCGTGGFSQRVTETLTLESYQLFQQLQGYILSLALQANGFVISRSTGISALDVAAEIANVNCPSLSTAGNCNQWWIDNDTHSTYALHNPNDPENDHNDLTNKIVNNGWANLNDLFKVEGCSGKEVKFNSSSLGVDCIFNLKWCAYNYTANHAYLSSTQFLNCPDDHYWGYLCSSFSDAILLPQSYLGPLLFNDEYFCRKL